MRRLITITIVLALAGCATQEQRQASYAKTCSGYGFTEGTPEFANCMMQTAQTDWQRRAAIASALQRSANTMTRPVYMQPIPTPVQTNTNCQMIGNQMLCNSTTR